MTHLRRSLGTASIVFALIAAGPLQAAAPAGTDLWGGPAAKGVGANARFDTNIYVSSVGAATGSIDFLLGGATVASIPFTVPTRGVAVVPAPAAVDGMGAFLYHVRSDSSVNAWSETYNETPAGRFGTRLDGLPRLRLPRRGRRGLGRRRRRVVLDGRRAARARTSASCAARSRAQGCIVEVAAFDGGAPSGVGQIFTVPGSVGQQSLAALLPDAAEKSKLALRFRMLTGAGLPYAIKNDNLTSDGSNLSLSVARGAFSTAPVITDLHDLSLLGLLAADRHGDVVDDGRRSRQHHGRRGRPRDLGHRHGRTSCRRATSRSRRSRSRARRPRPRARSRSSRPRTRPRRRPRPRRWAPARSSSGAIPVAYTGTLVTITFDQHDSHRLDVHRERQPVHVHGRLRRPAPTSCASPCPAAPAGPRRPRSRPPSSCPATPSVDLLHGRPARGCGASTNIVLQWQTENTRQVTIDPVAVALRPRAERLGRNDDHGHDDLHAERLPAPRRHRRSSSRSPSRSTRRRTPRS